MPNGSTHSWQIKNASGSPTKSSDPGPSIELTFRFTGSSGKNNSVRSFGVRGWEINGPSVNVGASCYKNGCDDLGYQSEISGSVEEFTVRSPTMTGATGTPPIPTARNIVR
jgi:hypothetical protein